MFVLKIFGERIHGKEKERSIVYRTNIAGKEGKKEKRTIWNSDFGNLDVRFSLGCDVTAFSVLLHGFSFLPDFSKYFQKVPFHSSPPLYLNCINLKLLAMEESGYVKKTSKFFYGEKQNK